MTIITVPQWVRNMTLVELAIILVIVTIVLAAIGFGGVSDAKEKAALLSHARTFQDTLAVEQLYETKRRTQVIQWGGQPYLDGR